MIDKAGAVAERIAQRQISGKGAGGGSEPPNIDEAAARVVNALVRELKAIFPAWRQAWPDAEAEAAYKKAMVKGFVAAGIYQVEQIRYGLMRCRQLETDFVPSVGRFIGMCTPTPEALGLPSEVEAYGEAVRRAHPGANAGAPWSHPAVAHAAREVGLWNLLNLPITDSRRLFARCYSIACRALAAGEQLRPILVGLPEKPAGRSTPEVGRAALDKLRGRLRGQDEGGDDGR